MTTLHSLYYFCAVFGCVFVAVQMLLLLLAGAGGVDDSSGDSGDTDFDSSAGDGDNDTGEQQSVGHSDHSISFLKMLSIRTISAGMGFFGLVGLAGTSAELPELLTLLIAVVGGMFAFVLIYFLYRTISLLRYNGAVNLNSVIGCPGTVHVRIMPRRLGSGKVIVTQQGRTMEYEALTDEEAILVAGTPIVVNEVLSGHLVRVSRLCEKPSR